MAMSSPPPSYRYSIANRPGQVPASFQVTPGAADTLPAYSRRNTLGAQPRPHLQTREPTEHSFVLVEGRHPWATLKLRSSAKSAKSLPTFYEKENINGVFEIDADRAESPQSIVANIIGRIVTGSGSEDESQFLNVSVPIWSKSMDSPRMPSPSEGTGGSKLRGRCSWSLSIPIPKETMIKGRACRLPETFVDSRVGASVQYEFRIKIYRGKLRSDSKISTFFGYVPSTRPEAPSPLRQLAYQENSVLPGPCIDPDGWKALKTTSVRGVLFNTKPVEVKCTLFLAKPLSYTRGSVIPCSIILESSQSQLLDLLCTSEAVPVHLRRRVQYFCKSRPSQLNIGTGWTEQDTDVGTAVWWRSPASRDTAHTRYMEGEIRLSKDLKPSASLCQFTLSYNVVLCSFDIPGFSSVSSGPLLSEPVEIATKYAHGPRPQAYSPPGYNCDSTMRTHDIGPTKTYYGSPFFCGR